MSDIAPSTTAAPDIESGLPKGSVILRQRKTRPFFARHPWVLDSAVARIEGEPADGDVVDLMSEKNVWIARGILNRHSRIRVRLYSWDASLPLDANFWRSRFAQALQLRQELGYVAADQAARLVFSEADGLSGIIIDRFAQHIVLQANSLAAAVRLPIWIELVEQLLKPDSILVRGEPGLMKTEGVELLSETVRGSAPSGPITIVEHGIRYAVDLAAGQKTGFYLDQRENRRAAAEYMKDRRVLDMFCYSGGFALAAALLGGAREVHGYDSSEQAVRWARHNAESNGLENVSFHQQEAFQALDQLRNNGELFGAIILDPPKFTRNRYNVNEALRAYHRINRVAVDLLEPNGILVTCSCSGSVTREDFVDMLSGVAEKSRRTIQILQQRGAAPDHPVSTSCLENEYLKCFVCRVV